MSVSDSCLKNTSPGYYYLKSAYKSEQERTRAYKSQQ